MNHEKLDYDRTAKEFVFVSKRVLQRLHQNLLDQGYHFLSKQPIVADSDCDEIGVSSFEDSHGKLPCLIREWYKQLSSVDFRQSPEQYDDQVSPMCRLGMNCSLFFLPLSDIEDQLHQVHSEFLTPPFEGAAFFHLGGFASNCDPKGFWLPCNAVDPVIYDDGNGPITFGEELVGSMVSGGFPFWDKMQRSKKQTHIVPGVPCYLQIKERLLDGVREDIPHLRRLLTQMNPRANQ